MDRLSEASRLAYRALVFDTPGFTDYFYAASPVSELSDLNIASRPASRQPTRSIAGLRAIPWVFSWSQSRVMLPGWFGFGSGVAQSGLDRIDAYILNADGSPAAFPSSSTDQISDSFPIDVVVGSFPQ